MRDGKREKYCDDDSINGARGEERVKVSIAAQLAISRV